MKPYPVAEELLGAVLRVAMPRARGQAAAPLCDFPDEKGIALHESEAWACL